MVKKRTPRAKAKSNLLKSYEAKRNFAHSPEPKATVVKAKTPKDPSKSKRFVVHKHAATRLHYDLRLECEGVLRSWAIPRGPSLDPLEQRLSVHVEDHPFSYGEFEGVIPKGNYGAGSVIIWDEGTYSLFETLPRESHDQTFLRQFRKGSLKLDFHGKKLRGQFALVKMKNTSGDDWLLIKKRDSFATPKDILMEETSVRSGLTIGGVAKAQEKSVSTKKEKIPSLPAKVEKLLKDVPKKAIPAEGIVVKSTKNKTVTHGMEVIVKVVGTGVEIRSLKGLNLTPRCREIVEELQKFPESVFVGTVSLAKPPLSFFVSDVLWLKKHYVGEMSEDKRREILLALPFAQPISVGQGTPEVAKTSSQGVRVTLTNPKKIFWPKERYTKKDVFDYYKEVGEIILPYLRDRPQSLNRHPDGIGKKGFFQKEVAGSVPGWVETTNVDAYGGTKTVTYMLCQNLDTLLYMANMGCIEINPWLSRVPHLLQPDYAVIDIDPGTLGFQEVIKGAKVVRKILEDIGAHGFCKTSGGRGVHIYLPLASKVEFSECQKFAELVGAAMCKELPKISSTEHSPLKRRNKLYIDSLQNRKGQTMASVYSLRPLSGAPVSTPIAWSELTAKLDPSKFNIRTALKRFEKVGDLWADMSKKKNDLRKLMSTLSSLHVNP